MARYRVYFRRVTAVELYVEADSERAAIHAADLVTAEGDGALTERPETYEYYCGPTGEVLDLAEYGPEEEV